ncbi:MAG: hypothetical protein WDZ49_07580 [Litorilinea sp.]
MIQPINRQWSRLRAYWTGVLTGEHQPFLLLLALFATFRVLTIFLFRPGGFIVDHSDYDFYYEWGALVPMGYHAFENLWTVYPPLFPAFMLTIFEWSSRVPQWVEPRLIFHLYFGAFMVAFECGNFICLYWLGRRLAHDDGVHHTHTVPETNIASAPAGFAAQMPAGLWPAVLYGFLFSPVYTMAGWFEAMPTFFLLLGLCLLLAKGPWWWLSALAAGLGFLTKLTPILLLPVAIRWLGAKLSLHAARHAWFIPNAPGNLGRPLVYTLLFFAVVIGLGYPLVGYNLDLAFVSFQIQPLRPPWQSIWAILDGYYGWGLVPISMRNLEGLSGPPASTRLPWTWISLGFLALYLFLYTRPYNWQRIRTPIAFTGLSVTLLFLYSKGWSPQFVVWILVFIVLLLPQPRWILAACVLMLTNLAESTIYLLMVPSQYLLIGTVFLRTGLLILLCLELVYQILPPADLQRGRVPGSQTGRNARIYAAIGRTLAPAVWSIMLVAIVAGTLGTPRLIDRYVRNQTANYACKPTVDRLQATADWPGTTLVTQQPALWHAMNPFVYRDYEFIIIDGYDTQDRYLETALARLDQQRAARHPDTAPEFWWVARADLDFPGSSPAQVWETFVAHPDVYMLGEYAEDPCTLRHVVDFRDRTPLAHATVPGAESDAGTGADTQSPAAIHLRDAAWQVDGSTGELRVVLYWQAQSALAASYTVFVHALDDTGALAGQQDNLPVEGLAPTTHWTPNAIIRDPYRLGSFDQPPTRLHVGLYDETGRVEFELPDGTVRDYIEIVLNP